MARGLTPRARETRRRCARRTAGCLGAGAPSRGGGGGGAGGNGRVSLLARHRPERTGTRSEGEMPFLGGPDPGHSPFSADGWRRGQRGRRLRPLGKAGQAAPACLWAPLGSPPEAAGPSRGRGCDCVGTLWEARFSAAPHLLTRACHSPDSVSLLPQRPRPRGGGRPRRQTRFRLAALPWTPPPEVKGKVDTPPPQVQSQRGCSPVIPAAVIQGGGFGRLHRCSSRQSVFLGW